MIFTERVGTFENIEQITGQQNALLPDYDSFSTEQL